MPVLSRSGIDSPLSDNGRNGKVKQPSFSLFFLHSLALSLTLSLMGVTTPASLRFAARQRMMREGEERGKSGGGVGGGGEPRIRYVVTDWYA